MVCKSTHAMFLHSKKFLPLEFIIISFKKVLKLKSGPLTYILTSTKNTINLLSYPYVTQCVFYTKLGFKSHLDCFMKYKNKVSIKHYCTQLWDMISEEDNGQYFGSFKKLNKHFFKIKI